MRVILTLTLSFILPVVSFLQSDIAFIAYTDADGVIPGQPFDVSFEIKNVKVQSFDAPDFGSLEVIRGPAVTNSMQMINGQRSMSRTYVYTLTGSKAGRYTIPPASARTEKGVLRSNPIEIDIKPLHEGQDLQAKEIILQIVPSDTHVYVGEQLILDYILYFQEPVERIYTANELDFSGFYRDNKVNQFPRSVQRTSFNGKPYSKKIIQRDVLFGQQSGEYTFGPLFCEVKVLEENGRSPFSFFRNTSRKEVIAEAVPVKVIPLPDTLPGDFSGGVGKYEMDVQLQQRQVSIGEAAEILVRVEGNGDPNILDPPILRTEGTARIFDPQLINESRTEKQGRLHFSRSWNYLVVPEEQGPLSLHFSFIYLDVGRNSIDTLISPTIEIWANPEEVQSVTDIDTNDSDNFSDGKISIWVYLLSVILLVSFIGALFFRFRVPSVKSNTPRRKIRQLIDLLKQELNNAKPELSLIKKNVQDILDESILPEHRESKIREVKRNLERYQFSQERDESKIRALMNDLLSELRKAESELE